MAVSHIDHVTTLHLLGPGAQKCQLLGWLDVLPKGRVMEMINKLQLSKWVCWDLLDLQCFNEVMAVRFYRGVLTEKSH